ncbi:hypothetical protein IAR50_006423 [Cryptococcus sp. DSM 104548]
MDSPLLPTLSHPKYDPSDDASLSLADISLGEDGFSPLPPAKQLHSVDSDWHKSRDDRTESGRKGHEVGFDLPTRSDAVEKPSSWGGAGKPRFSLFAPPKDYDQSSSHSLHENEQDEREQLQNDEPEGENTQEGLDEGQEDDAEKTQSQSQSRAGETGTDSDRDKRLRESLYELRKFNEVFDGFIGALEGVKGHNERLAERVQQTSALLDEYTAILGQSEHTKRLLSNPRWTGASDDQAAIAAEQAAAALAQHRAQQEEAARVEALRREEEERQRRAEQREKEKEKEGALAARRGVARGRGRIGMGVGRGGAGSGSTARGTGIPRPSSLPRPSSATGSASSARRGAPSTTASGTVGNYTHVKSSGYGPRRP